jgi:NDP-4-keto-2,6-dideoxyhexose 3-C-methyltransferase
MIRAIQKCRICGNARLAPVLNLGAQPLSSVFPEATAPDPSLAPLELVKCEAPAGESACGLLQLRHSANVSEMYGQTYGYRSGTSPTMRAHLKAKVDRLLAYVRPSPGDVVLDIGCNDGTLLNYYDGLGLDRFGIDPSSEKFIDNFQPGIRVVFDFFSAGRLAPLLKERRCRIVTSIAMFYDLEDPLDFMRGIKSVLSPDGVWGFELSYLPLMFTNLTYDQVCHEHLLYLGLRQIEWLAERAGLRILDIGFNDMNGGSVDLIAGHAEGPRQSNEGRLEAVRRAEEPLGSAEPYERFGWRVAAHRDSVRAFFDAARAAQRSVYGYGASTKGNIVLNYCGLGPEDLVAICDKQAQKHDLVTPGVRIPIISQEQMRRERPDYLFVLIWHLRREVILDERVYLEGGGRLVFHLPHLHIVDKDNWQRYLDRPFADLGYSL